MRKLISHAFSEAALREQLPLIVSHMKVFIHQIEQRASQSPGNSVDLNEWFNYLAFDVVTDLSFGEPLGALERGTSDPFIDGFFKACKMFAVVPMVHEYSLFKLFFKAMMCLPPVRKSQERGYIGTKSKVEKRMGMKTERKDFMTYVRANHLNLTRSGLLCRLDLTS